MYNYDVSLILLHFIAAGGVVSKLKRKCQDRSDE